ncbi:mechanosensitive ion channel family protein [Granulicella arctica]|uniref:Small-conductance mechanosensitive channel n=1 Tax=Granulicella arctica TaxID=940613 RepID=A0A7Y9PDU1_9BACT|nr:mechanosensitive ion channel family protein [Granulicella arctica]NYF78034.1 small-conductance mechanosensitive channel [Granulicella arctica]
MRNKRQLLWIVPAVLLVLCLVGSFVTRGAMADLQFLRSRHGVGQADVVDQRPLQTAQTLFSLAVSAEEQAFAHEAIRVADHEVDQAFAMALRQANTEGRTLTGKALDASNKVTALQQTAKQDQAAVDALVASASARNPGADDDDLDVAKAQLALDKDELDDAQSTLAIVTGDQRGKIQEELAAHEAGMKKYENHAGDGEIAVVSSQRFKTLAGRLKAWFDQRSRISLLEQAKAQADADTASLTTQYGTLQQKATALTGTEKQVQAADAPPIAALPGAVSAQAATAAPARPSRLVLLRRLEAQRNILGILNDRIESQKELSSGYAKWLAQVQLQHQIVVHLLLHSFAWIAFIVLCAVLLSSLISVLVERRVATLSVADRRSMHTFQTVLQLVVQALALLLILLVVFGPPSQMPTILGLATAGLTVVFQDFILAFFGWFVLMGKNGIRVGDWVEINGVGGEVVEIGLFRTALLETGNWTDKGHPTGRRTTFVNKYAISGQYFNFSTTGQWMWDEIKVNIPTSADSYDMIERIHKVVLDETAKDTEQAERELQRASQQHGVTQFSATPSVDMRPASSGIDIVVRYVTRAGDRLEMRNRLYQSVIGLMRVPAPAIEATTGK